MTMPSNRGFSVRIFLPDGDPDGLRIVEKSNWTGRGLVIPRSIYPEAKGRSELDRTGVYILVGPSEASSLPTVYVGEGDPIRPRLDSHYRSKDFWQTALTFTSKDENLNKAHVQYLEARLLQLASLARQCELDNGNVPQLPSLSEADAADVDGFLSDIILCLPILGVSVFETTSSVPISGQPAAPAPSPVQPMLSPPLAAQATTATPQLLLQPASGVQTPHPSIEYRIRGKGVEAWGYEVLRGVLVRKGSRVVTEETPTCPPGVVDLRRSLIKSNVLLRHGTIYVFEQDYTFASPSTAACVVLGRSANGRTEWMTADGRTLKAVQNARAGHA